MNACQKTLKSVLGDAYLRIMNIPTHQISLVWCKENTSMSKVHSLLTTGLEKYEIVQADKHPLYRYVLRGEHNEFLGWCEPARENYGVAIIVNDTVGEIEFMKYHRNLPGFVSLMKLVN